MWLTLLVARCSQLLSALISMEFEALCQKAVQKKLVALLLGAMLVRLFLSIVDGLSQCQLC
jgi:hypothetical protein